MGRRSDNPEMYMFGYNNNALHVQRNVGALDCSVSNKGKRLTSLIKLKGKHLFFEAVVTAFMTTSYSVPAEIFSSCAVSSALVFASLVVLCFAVVCLLKRN